MFPVGCIFDQALLNYSHVHRTSKGTENEVLWSEMSNKLSSAVVELMGYSYCLGIVPNI